MFKSRFIFFIYLLFLANAEFSNMEISDDEDSQSALSGSGNGSEEILESASYSIDLDIAWKPEYNDLNNLNTEAAIGDAVKKTKSALDKCDLTSKITVLQLKNVKGSTVIVISIPSEEVDVKLRIKTCLMDLFGSVIIDDFDSTTLLPDVSKNRVYTKVSEKWDYTKVTEKWDYTKDPIFVGTSNSETQILKLLNSHALLAAVVLAAVAGLFCTIICLVFIVYKLRKKDGGSYPLKETRKYPIQDIYFARSREIYA